LALVQKPARAGKVNRAGEGVAIHEDAVLLTEAEVAEVREGEAQPERVAAADRLVGAIKKRRPR